MKIFYILLISIIMFTGCVQPKVESGPTHFPFRGVIVKTAPETFWDYPIIVVDSNGKRQRVKHPDCVNYIVGDSITIYITYSPVRYNKLYR